MGLGIRDPDPQHCMSPQPSGLGRQQQQVSVAKIQIVIGSVADLTLFKIPYPDPHTRVFHDINAVLRIR
jgi:hypothetical protein